jgi:hypothetical protein
MEQLRGKPPECERLLRQRTEHGEKKWNQTTVHMRSQGARGHRHLTGTICDPRIVSFQRKELGPGLLLIEAIYFS